MRISDWSSDVCSSDLSLGYREYGGRAALPIWIDYMRVALEDRPIATNEPPDGMVKVSVAANGTLIPDGGGGITEYVKVEDLERMQNYTDYSDEDALDEEERSEAHTSELQTLMRISYA